MTGLVASLILDLGFDMVLVLGQCVNLIISPGLAAQMIPLAVALADTFTDPVG